MKENENLRKQYRSIVIRIKDRKSAAFSRLNKLSFEVLRKVFAQELLQLREIIEVNRFLIFCTKSIFILSS